jgi:hypothetical protein
MRHGRDPRAVADKRSGLACMAAKERACWCLHKGFVRGAELIENTEAGWCDVLKSYHTSDRGEIRAWSRRSVNGCAGRLGRWRVTWS